jgi:hypothetical protein
MPLFRCPIELELETEANIVRHSIHLRAPSSNSESHPFVLHRIRLSPSPRPPPRGKKEIITPSSAFEIRRAPSIVTHCLPRLTSEIRRAPSPVPSSLPSLRRGTPSKAQHGLGVGGAESSGATQFLPPNRRVERRRTVPSTQESIATASLPSTLDTRGTLPSSFSHPSADVTHDYSSPASPTPLCGSYEILT